VLVVTPHNSVALKEERHPTEIGPVARGGISSNMRGRSAARVADQQQERQIPAVTYQQTLKGEPPTNTETQNLKPMNKKEAAPYSHINSRQRAAARGPHSK
jgi:hypothetical protein